MSKSEVEQRWERAVNAAYDHAQRCRRCFMPIVKDAEGNPGLYSEACADGARILREWMDAEKAAVAGGAL